MEHDDLVGEGVLCYYKAKEKYNPKRAKFITLFYLVLRHKYAQLLNKAYRHRLGELPADSGERFSAHRPPMRIDELCYRSLSREAWLMIRELLKAERKPRLADLFQRMGVSRREGRRMMWKIAHAINPKIA